MIKTISLVLVLVLVLTLVGSIARGGIVFLDDFEDGSATDGAPVTWTPVPSATGSFEVIDGDYVLTRPSPIEEMYCYVNQYTTLADTSIRTQARLIPGGWWLGLFTRGNLGEGLYISLLKNNERLEIWRFGASYYVGSMLASADVGIDPRAQDVLLRFDVIGNELSAWAWREGDPMPAEPQVRAVHSEFATGGVGVAADLGSPLSNNKAIFRYVEVYEPSPSTPDFNGDGIVDGADMCMMIEYWGTDEPSYDIAPPHFGDGIVDIQDLIVLAEDLFTDYRATAQWKLDEEEGDIAYDSVGGHDAILHGEPLWQPTSGNSIGALEFDGIDDYVSTPYVLNPAVGSFSAFAWMKGGAPGDVIITQVGSNGEIWLSTNPLDGKLMTGLGDTYFDILESESVIVDGQWHHIGLVYDMDVLHRRLYVDGAQVAEDATFVAPQLSNEGLHIGASKDLDAASFFSGLIDNVRIYNVALTAEQIAMLTQ